MKPSAAGNYTITFIDKLQAFQREALS